MKCPNKKIHVTLHHVVFIVTAKYKERKQYVLVPRDILVTLKMVVDQNVF